MSLRQIGLVSTLIVLLSGSTLWSTPLQPQTSTEIRYTGMCDASAGIAMDSTTFVVANDEDDILRLYSFAKPSSPLDTVDIRKSLIPDPDDKKDKEEADIEACARLGNTIFWICSHSMGKNKAKPRRHQLFATTVSVNGNKLQVTVTGKPYPNLVKDLAADTRYEKYQFNTAAGFKVDEGGLNIEGMCVWNNTKLLIGLRSPIGKKTDGSVDTSHALLIPLENPVELLATSPAQKPKFGDPIEIDLGGRGIRDIVFWEAKKTYVITAGDYTDGRNFALFTWSGASNQQPTMVKGIDLYGFSPEAILPISGSPKNELLLLSDDGDEPVDGSPCKDKSVPAGKKSFRSSRIFIEKL